MMSDECGMMNERRCLIHHSAFITHHSILTATATVTAATLLRGRPQLGSAGITGWTLYRPPCVRRLLLAALRTRLAFEAFDLGGREVAPLAYQNPVGGDGADADAAELDDGVPDGVEHAANLLVATLAQGQLVPRVRLRLVGLDDLGGR